MKYSPLILSVLVLSGSALMTAQASSDSQSIQEMQKTIQMLQTRIEALEAVKPTFTSFMPDFSERFHVLHRAGEAGDWAVAGHELSEMKRMAALTPNFDPEKSKLLEAMLSPSLESIEATIEDGDLEAFNTAMEGTINACNACHTASGSPFIKVTLDARDAISLRHPHALGKSKMAAGHTHGGAGHGDDEMAMMQNGMEGGHKHEAGEEDHHDDEAGAEDHHDDEGEGEAHKD